MHDGEANSLRPIELSDLEKILSWRNDPEVRRYMYTQHVITLEEHRNWFERIANDRQKHALIFQMADHPAGFVSFSELPGGGVAEWGFYTAPDAPKGMGYKLGCAALTYAFGQLEMHKVAGQALAFNTRSIQFHRDLGFEQEGTLREHRFDGERYHDVVCFGLVRQKWQEKVLT